MAAVTGTDPQALAQSFLDSSTVNEAEGWVSRFDPTILQNAQDDAEIALADYIANDLPDDATVADVLGGRRIITQDYETLPASIPNRLTVVGARYDELPNALRNRLALSFDVDLFGQPRSPVRFPWAAVNGQRLTLSFSPATPEDEEALLALLPDGEITDLSQLPASIPSHLVEVVPEIRLNGEVVASGSAMNLGEEIDFNFTVSQLGYGDDLRVSPVVAGSYLAVAVAGGSVSPVKLKNLQQKVAITKSKLDSGDAGQIDTLTREDLMGDLFYAGVLAYFGEFDTLATWQGRQRDVNHNLATSVGTFGYEPTVSYFFGLPNSIERGGVVMDLDRVAWIQGAMEPSPVRTKLLNIQAGAFSSALEHGVPEQLFSTKGEQVEGISAVKALSIANAEGQEIYNITQANQNELMPKLNLDADTMDEIRAVLAAGKQVTTHTDPVSVLGWQGAGYVILDPGTGAGAWKIAGGKNGGLLNFLLQFIKGFLWAVWNVIGTFNKGALARNSALYTLVFAFDVYQTVTSPDLNVKQKIGTILVGLLVAIALIVVMSALMFFFLSAPFLTIVAMGLASAAINLVGQLLKMIVQDLLVLILPKRAEVSYS